MALLKKKNLILVFFCLIFLSFPPKSIPSGNSLESEEYTVDTYYKKYLRDYYYKQGKEFYTQGRYREALFKFKSALKCEPNYKPAIIFEALVEAKVAQQQKIEEQKITRQKERKDELAKEYFAPYYFKQGVFYLNKAHYQEAIDKFKEALKWMPGYEPALKYLVLSEDKLNQQSKSEEEKEADEVKKEEAKAKEQLRDFYYKQGIDYFKQVKYNEAISSFKQSLEINPQYKPALKYIVLSQDKIAQQKNREEEKKIIEEKRKEAREQKEKIIAAKKLAQEKVAQEKSTELHSKRGGNE